MREARSTVGAGGGRAAVVAFVNVPLVDVPLVVLLPLNITCSTQGLPFSPKLVGTMKRKVELKGTVYLFGFFHGKLNSPCAVEWY